jgi:hypothetical protein
MPWRHVAQPHLRMWVDDVLLQIKIDYLAEIIIICITRDDMFDFRVVQHCHWWCGLSSVR